jgi:hypothetical protein
MKSLKLKDWKSASLLIKLGADVCLCENVRTSPISIIFCENITELKSVIKEYFSAKKYKEFESKYQVQGFMSRKNNNQQEEKSINLFFKNDKNEGHLKNNNYKEPDCHTITSRTKSELSKDQNKKFENASFSILPSKNRNASEEVLTNNTLQDKTNEKVPNIRTSPDQSDNIKSKINGNLNKNHSLNSYKKKILSYSDQIDKMKSMIESTKQVI